MAGLFLMIFATITRTIADMALVGAGWLHVGFRIGSLVREIIALDRQDHPDAWVWA